MSSRFVGRMAGLSKAIKINSVEKALKKIKKWVVVFFICPLLFMSFLNAGEKITASSESFEASMLPPVFKVPAKMKKGEKQFRIIMKQMPEAQLVALVTTFAYKEIGLSEAERNELMGPITREYASFEKHSSFKDLPSAFPYCYNSKKNKQGHYFLVRPETVTDGMRAIVFLHGYAGNFQVYPKIMSEAFPDSVIICPSWGISWSNGNPEYVTEAIEDARKKLEVNFGDIWLVGLSAGGKGGFKVYNKKPGIFKGYISIAASPGVASLNFKKDAKILMINGMQDKRFPIEHINRLESRIKIPGFKTVKVKGGHYFLITDKANTFKIMHDFINQSADIEK